MNMTIDGAVYRRMLLSAAASIERNQEALNELNGGALDEAALLDALRPFLSAERRRRLDRALRLARLASLASLAGELGALGGEEPV